MTLHSTALIVFCIFFLFVTIAGFATLSDLGIAVYDLNEGKLQ